MKNNIVRIIGGEFRGRKIYFPDVNGLRPTSSILRETLFNWLQPYIYGSICLDVFAGSGAIGIEAISRGAKLTKFCEKNSIVKKTIEKTLQTLNILNAEVYSKNGIIFLTQLNTQKEQYIIFLDPPFNTNLLQESLTAIINNTNISPETIIYVESEKNVEKTITPHFKIMKQKKTGQVFSYLVKKN